MMEGAGPGQTKSLTQAMHLAWLAFVQNGDPNHSGMPHWSTFEAAHEVMRFDTESRVEPGLLDNESALWSSIGISKLSDLERAFAYTPAGVH